MMLNKILSSKVRYALLSFLVLAGIQEVRALPLCPTASLAEYISLDSAGGCLSNDLTFFRFSYATPVSTGGAPVAAASDVLVTPLNSSIGIGFSFSSSYFMLNNPTTVESATYGIGYSVDPPPIIVGEGLSLDPPYGAVNVVQNLCQNDVVSNGCAYGIPVTQRVTPTSPTSFVYFPSPVPFVDVQTMFTLSASPGNPAGFDALQTGSLLTVPTAAPEPASAALSGLAVMIATAGLYFRRKRT